MLGVLALGAMVLLTLHTPPARAADAQPSLAVDPLPLGSHPAATTPMLSWSTGTGAPGGGACSPRRTARTGSWRAAAAAQLAAPWVTPDSRLTFSLFQTAQKRQRLATFAVGGGAAAKPADLRPAAATPAATPHLFNALLRLLSFAGVRWPSRSSASML